MDMPTSGEPDWSRLPARAGVVVFESPDERTVLLGTSADVRQFARRRLEDNESKSVESDTLPAAPSPRKEIGKSGRTNLRSVTGRVLAATTGSAFEAEWLYLRLAYERMPTTHRAATEQWVGWFIRINPSDKHPRWEKAATTGLERVAAINAELHTENVFLGPIADKHAAGRVIETLDDLFDLCRYYHVLVQSPNASACAYKEMGKCPAPCDGSETLESYRDRVRRAAAFAGQPVRGLLEAEEHMKAAAAEMRFEDAARLKRWIDRAASLTKGASRWIDDLNRLAVVIVGRSEKTGWSRLCLARGGYVIPFLDLRTDAETAEAAQSCASWLEKAGDVEWTSEHADTLGLLSRWLYMPGKPILEFVRARWEKERPLIDADELTRAMISVHKPRRTSTSRSTANESSSGSSESGFVEQSIESLEGTT